MSDLSKVNIQFKDNQLLVTINEKNSHIYKAVRFYCANDKEDSRNRVNRISIKQKFKNRTRKLQTAPMLPNGSTRFFYKDVIFTIQIIEFGDPLASEGGWTGFHEQMYILMDENDKTYEENKEILLSFQVSVTLLKENGWIWKTKIRRLVFLMKILKTPKSISKSYNLSWME